jgi:hypothetical protein
MKHTLDIAQKAEYSLFGGQESALALIVFKKSRLQKRRMKSDYMRRPVLDMDIKASFTGMNAEILMAK